MSYGGQGNFENPYHNAPAPKSNTKTILIVLGVIGGLCLLCCGGVAIFTYSAAKMGMSAVGGVVIESVKSNPDLVAELGEVQSATLNFQATGEYAKGGKEGYLVLDVKGSKGTGKLAVRMDRESVSEAIFIRSDGTEVPLVIAEPDFQGPVGEPTEVLQGAGSGQ